MTSERPRLFERLKSALEEGIRTLDAGTARTWEVTAPIPARKRTPARIRALREALAMTQLDFAAALNVSIKTVQAWEQGVRKPDGAALRLLQILAEFPQVMEHVPAMRYSRKLVTRGETAQGQPRRRKRVA
jgi:putative transcriptional regulator